MHEFRIDEGHFFSIEDYIFNVKWKVKDLLECGYPTSIILEWEDNDTWYYYAKLIIDEYETHT